MIDLTPLNQSAWHGFTPAIALFSATILALIAGTAYLIAFDKPEQDTPLYRLLQHLPLLPIICVAIGLPMMSASAASISPIGAEIRDRTGIAVISCTGDVDLSWDSQPLNQLNDGIGDCTWMTGERLTHGTIVAQNNRIQLFDTDGTSITERPRTATMRIPDDKKTFKDAEQWSADTYGLQGLVCANTDSNSILEPTTGIHDCHWMANGRLTSGRLVTLGMTEMALFDTDGNLITPTP